MAINLSLKNVPLEVYERLKTSARQNRRSLNSEILARLEQSAQPAPAPVDELLARIRAVRATLPQGKAKAKDIRRLINEGRP